MWGEGKEGRLRWSPGPCPPWRRHQGGMLLQVDGGPSRGLLQCCSAASGWEGWALDRGCFDGAPQAVFPCIQTHQPPLPHLSLSGTLPSPPCTHTHKPLGPGMEVTTAAEALEKGLHNPWCATSAAKSLTCHPAVARLEGTCCDQHWQKRHTGPYIRQFPSRHPMPPGNPMAVATLQLSALAMVTSCKEAKLCSFKALPLNAI